MMSILITHPRKLLAVYSISTGNMTSSTRCFYIMTKPSAHARILHIFVWYRNNPKRYPRMSHAPHRYTLLPGWYLLKSKYRIPSHLRKKKTLKHWISRTSKEKFSSAVRNTQANRKCLPIFSKTPMNRVNPSHVKNYIPYCKRPKNPEILWQRWKCIFSLFTKNKQVTEGESTWYPYCHPIAAYRKR